MAIIKQSSEINRSQVDVHATTAPVETLSSEAFIQALQGDDIHQTLYAIHQLEDVSATEFQQYQALLFALLERDVEQNPCSDAVFSLLATRNSHEITTRLIPLLDSEAPYLRNQAIEILQHSPQQLERHIQDLLNHQDPDVRIFAIDIIGLLPHESVPQWLQQVLEHEEHINVIGTAIDRIAQLSDPSFLTLLLEVKQRFSHVPYLVFACDVAIQRLNT
ncbi:HEAT repeat domain-containing protein [Vibrio metoecus]|uniref:HEAT repeat domain-containing protein n=1 Tax=Vibrio metoecus TaxID=1481663 RepID=UPI0001B99BC2|nr:HEAT repeat domain-containing protein [Vibrio metoecus]EEX66447.1 hypothetical protein VCJ_001126 [Vibrio metoecus]PAR32325.1 HEAT repeat domain-containing protein [Vibrio metoecus]